MKTFTIYCEERVARSYTVKAETAEAAKARLLNGEYDAESPGEALDVEIVDIEEEGAS